MQYTAALTPLPRLQPSRSGNNALSFSLCPFALNLLTLPLIFPLRLCVFALRTPLILKLDLGDLVQVQHEVVQAVQRLVRGPVVQVARPSRRARSSCGKRSKRSAARPASAGNPGACRSPGPAPASAPRRPRTAPRHRGKFPSRHPAPPASRPCRSAPARWPGPRSGSPRLRPARNGRPASASALPATDAAAGCACRLPVIDQHPLAQRHQIEFRRQQPVAQRHRSA